MISVLFQNTRLLSLLAALLVVAGLGALYVLPVAEDPRMENRFALVLTAYPGASAERVEALVTEKLELKLRELAEIKEISSNSGNGLSSIQIALDDNVYDPEPVWSRARDLIADVQPLLPRGTQPSQLLDKRGYAYTMLIALRPAQGFEVPRQILQRYARELQSRLRADPGTDVVNIDGGVAEEVQVHVDAARAAAAGQTVSSIAAALQGYDTKSAAGVVENASSRMQVEIAGDLDSVERVSRVPLEAGQGAQVLRVGDVAQVARVVKQPEAVKVLRDGQAQVVVAARMLYTQRIARWQARMMDEVNAFDLTLPSNLEMEVIFDQLDYTNERMAHLSGNIAIGFLLILLILLLTLGWRSAILVAAALPLMTLFTFFLMNLTGVPINQMSVTGLVVALGITVDNAIVMVDDIGQRLRRGTERLAAVKGAVAHLWMPLFGSSATTILAFMPVVLQPGPAGEFVGALAMCVIFSLIGSYLISFTLVAALAGKFIVRKPNGGWWRQGLQSVALTSAFQRVLRAALNRPRRAVAMVMVLPALGFYGVTTLPKQFFPPVDRDMFTIEVTLPTRASFDRTEALVRDLDQVLEQTPGISSVDWFVGKSAAPFYYNLIERQFGAQNFAQAMVVTNSPADTQRLVTELQRSLPVRFTAARIITRKLEQGPPVDQPVEVFIYGADLATLEKIGNDLRLMLSSIAGVTDTTASLGQTIPAVTFSLREEVLAGSSLSPDVAADTLRASLDGLVVGALLENTEEVPVRVRLQAQERSTPRDIQSLNVFYGERGSGFNATALQAVASMSIDPSVVSIPHREGQRVNTIGAYLLSDVLPDTVATQLQTLMESKGYQVPPGYRIEFGGEQAKRSESIAGLASSVPLIFVLLIVVLVVSFNSWRLCLLILAVAALSVGLGMLSLVLSGYAFAFQVIIGLLGLMGLAINGAIVILAELRATPKALAGDIEGIVEAVTHCTRHITSTTITTAAGFTPLLVGGGLFWPPFATAIVGGTVMVTILSFVFVPASFLLMVRHKPFEIRQVINPALSSPDTV
ncbi:MAG: efflux RND transporter permease subunit [Gammaproteobacteria bacterium]|nr:efflux RND transporter permease subunit [Gammaproteobacteria bacterium]